MRPTPRRHAFRFGPRPCSARASAVTAFAIFSSLIPYRADYFFYKASK